MSVCELTCVYYMFHIYICYSLGLVDSLSTTQFVLSPEPREWNQITILCDHSWPSWVPLLNLWFTSNPHTSIRQTTIVIISKDRSMFNLFGLNRQSNVKWSSQDLCLMTNAQLINVLLRTNACFYDGSVHAWLNIYRSWSSLPETLRPQLFCAMHNKYCLRTLNQCTDIIWQRASHGAVGGVTATQIWIGFSMPTLQMPESEPRPSYCPHIINDLLEFAPGGVNVLPLNRRLLLDNCNGRHLTPVPFEAVPYTFYSSGLLPLIKSSYTQLPRVACPTPFTPSRFCLREFTTKELTRFLDLPVAFKHRLLRAFGLTPSLSNPLLKSIPLKLLQHALYVSGVLEILALHDMSNARVGSQGGTQSDVTSLDEDNLNNDHETSRREASTSATNRLGDSNFNPARNQYQGQSRTDLRKHTQVSSLLVPQATFHQSKTSTSQIDVKATKTDSAAVPTYLWDNEVAKAIKMDNEDPQLIKALNIVRKYALKVWKRSIVKSFITYLKHTHPASYSNFMHGNRKDLDPEFVNDLEAGLDCLYYAGNATWWEWDYGSRLFFWRWPSHFVKYARDGISVCWKTNQRPSNKRLQPQIHDQNMKSCMKKKIDSVKQKKYIKPGKVTSLIRYFAVPKGDADVRMVYDGTDSGFNDMIWVPSFGLPTVNTLLRGTSPTTWMVDLDIGKMFLNFMLDQDAQQYVGVDLTPLSSDGYKAGEAVIWEKYSRCAMGLAMSPNHTTRAILIAEEFLTGMPWEFSNPFHYHEVRLNLPGSKSYCPGQPWFSLRRYDNELSSILAIYVDDERVQAPSYELAVLAARQVASRESYLGVQDAARKRRPPSQQAGAWAGSIIHTNNEEVGVLVSNERWTKAREIIRLWLSIVENDHDPELCTETLISHRGFLVYVARTYDVLTTYLKGIHLTIDGWRSNRDREGWKTREVNDHMRYKDDSCDRYYHKRNKRGDYPEKVRPVPRLLLDLKALHVLTESKQPPVLLVQTNRVYVVRYLFGDASGSGFGTTILTGNKMAVEFGTWSEAGAANSSNFREFANLVMKLESEALKGQLDGAEIFLFTDNSTTECAFHNGTSTSKTLFELVLRMKVIQLKHATKIHVIHVAGTRMISQGTDGLSRGNLFEGVLTSGDMLSHVPIHLGACERSGLLLDWIREWTSEPMLKPLRPEEWIWRGQGLAPYTMKNLDGMSMPVEGEEEVFLWSPAPCVADVALEYIRKSVHKRPQLTHIVVIPKLMTNKWRKHLLKHSQFSFYIDPGHTFWSELQHESLLICFFLPQLSHSPWTIKRSPKVLAMERLLREMQKRKDGSEQIILLKFWNLCRKLPTMPSGVVRKVLSSGKIRQVSY